MNGDVDVRCELDTSSHRQSCPLLSFVRSRDDNLEMQLKSLVSVLWRDRCARGKAMRSSMGEMFSQEGYPCSEGSAQRQR
uniref:Uncharacterized protein n=1 Tax=Ascaris lumbricoides TaxID=6252 RepID=A0A0M3HNF7_ASCLU